MHADLKHEPKKKPEYLAREQNSHSISKCGLSHRKKKEWKKKKNGKTKKPLPLPSALKATNGTIINDNNHLSHSSRVADHVILKLLKVLAEKPQCKSISNARNAPTDPTLRMLPKDFVFQPKVPVLGLPSARAKHTHSVGTCPLGLGELDLAVRFTCRDSYTSHQEHR